MSEEKEYELLQECNDSKVEAIMGNEAHYDIKVFTDMFVPDEFVEEYLELEAKCKEYGHYMRDVLKEI